MNKTAIKNFAINARKKLIADIVYKAGLLGVNEEKILSPLPQSTSDLQFFDVGTKEYTRISGDEIKQRNALMSAINAKAREIKYKDAFEYVVEEVAYTWFNRLIALRFMEVNDYLPSRVRVLSSENPAKAEPDFVTNPYDTDLEFTSAEQEKIMQLKDQNKLDDLFRMLFIKQCNKLHEILPGLFEQTSDYTELLLTISFTDKDGVIWHLIHDIEEKDFNVETLDENGNPTGQIEIIGWMYQYYNVEPKDKVFANLKNNIKISKENIPAATQLFTPDWIVRYMVENSLGRLWVEGHPNDALKSEWKYYLEEAEQEAEVQRQLSAIRKEYAELTPEDITCIDPCMGSGHILVYMFDVLMQIYESYGYTQRDAARLIVEKNLFGLDIDKRAYQLSYFAIMMKARQYNRRILNGELTPNVFAIQDSSELSAELIDFIANGDKNVKADLQTIKAELKDATEYGSILDVTQVNFARIYARMEEIESIFYEDIFGQMNQKLCKNTIKSVIKQAEIMAQDYWVVCTNPPYMGSANMSPKLFNYIMDNYADFKSDLFAVFILRVQEFSKHHGIYSLITQQAWMFKSSYRYLRRDIYKKTIINMLHLGPHAFDELPGEVVQTVSFTQRNWQKDNYVGRYVSLEEYGSEYGKQVAFMGGPKQYACKTENFFELPNQPTAYWITDKQADCFKKLYKLSECGITACAGLNTSDNGRFVRLWQEVDFERIGIGCVSHEDLVDQNKKYALFNKGGGYRKWYGNQYFVIAFDVENYSILSNIGNHLPSRQFYFQPSLTWNRISAAESFSVRKCDYGYAFDDVSPSAFMKDEMMDYAIGLMNAKPFCKLLCIMNRGMKTETGNVQKVPFVLSEEHFNTVKNIAAACIQIAKADWDSFEISWDFSVHPLVREANNLRNQDIRKITLSECFVNWENLCNKRFYKMKENEELLNRIFIELYGLQNDLEEQIDEKDITVRKADLVREIKSLLSYAVGCMFGRYSTNTSGLIYAGGQWDSKKYSGFIPDKDNCIPITDEAYFGDDIVEQFVDWMKYTFGEESIEENLEFIAKALGNKGITSREVIRNYFINGFNADHNSLYSVTGSGKRPIYWLFDSGKQNGFKALVYMHRWNADTVGNVRVEYLHKIQHIYEREIARMQEIIDAGRDSKEVNRASKRKAKLVKQLQETKDYDAKLAHIALSRIDIDLDDGVKVNYEKVQTGKDGKKQQILAKI